MSLFDTLLTAEPEAPDRSSSNKMADHKTSAFGNSLHDPSGRDFINIEPGPELQFLSARVMNAQNPLLEAARPLLHTLADMPAQLTLSQIENLRELLIREVQIFQTLCDRVNLRREHTLAVRYCLCTALDEAANKTEWGRSYAWAQKGLLITFHSETGGGEKVFLLIGRLSANPQEHFQVLEVIYHILGLGFEGRYSIRPDGRKQLDTIRQQLLVLLSTQRDAVAQQLSPHWQTEETAKLRLLRTVPLWVTGGAMILLLTFGYGWYNWHLERTLGVFEKQIEAIGVLPAPPLPDVANHHLRLKMLLQNEIRQQLVKVEESKQGSKVSFSGDAMFIAGQKNLNPEVLPVIDKVAAEIKRVGGIVTVIGHTDSQPIHTAEFPSNQVLSEKRAKEVAAILAEKINNGTTISTIGKGDSEPLAENKTPQGRALNRRVDIQVMETE